MLYEHFLAKGTELQYTSKDIKESKKHYDNCCQKCDLHNYQIKCKDCKIKLAHDKVQIKFILKEALFD